MHRVTQIEIVEDRTASSRCDEGFLRLKRFRARNRRSDGTLSPEYPIDVIDRRRSTRSRCACGRAAPPGSRC
ncbi:MAG TPA: hypothetical protein VF904_12865 [Anaeromyxobacteraceae bacterium]